MGPWSANDNELNHANPHLPRFALSLGTQAGIGRRNFGSVESCPNRALIGECLVAYVRGWRMERKSNAVSVSDFAPA